MSNLATVQAATRAEMHPAAGQVTLELERACKRWGSRTVLENVSLSIRSGELIWLNGANGVGKTTLLRIAAGMILPDKGSVSLDGFHPERDRREYLRRVGFLSAGDRALYPRLSARRHLRFAASLALLPRGRQQTAVAHAIDAFGLEEFADRRADRLSTGQRQRLRVAISLVHRPTMVILDEPANSLDRDGLEVLDAYLIHIRSRGGAAIWAAPSGVRPELHFDRHFRLENGQLMSE